MKVKDCYTKASKKVIIAKEDDPIEFLVINILEERRARSVYVVDDKMELSGIIPIVDIMHFVAPQFINGGFEGVRDLFAKKAKDLMKGPVYVSPETPLEDALKLMFEHKLEELPVIKNGKIIGDLDYLEAIEAIKRGVK